MSKINFWAVATLLMATATVQAQENKPKEAAQEERTEQKVRVKPYGFIRNYLIFDSRNTMTVCGGEYHLIPYDEDWNIDASQSGTSGITLPDGAEERYDRNAVPQTHFQALSSRFGLQLTGPMLMGAKSSGRLEGDFAGFGTNNTVLRLRLAYVQLDWPGEASTHSLLVGQDWHPLCGNIMPEAIGMANGSPFRPHNRSPQLRYTFSHNRLGFMAAAIYQFQYTSPGPSGESAQYANQSLVPELFVGISYRDEHIFTQLGADYQRLTIRETMNALPNGTATPLPYLFKGNCNSLSPTFYFQYVNQLFSMKMRSTLAQNLGHMNMLSGYARVIADDDPGTWQYKPLRASDTYVDLAYGKTWRANLLLGYHKNLGLADGYSIDGTAIYMKKGVTNINSIYRIAPSISYNCKAFNIGLEYEWTGVTYGDLQTDGTVADNNDLHQVANHRVCAMVKYNF